MFCFVLCCPTPATAKQKLKALVENSELVKGQLEKVTPIKNTDHCLTLHERAALSERHSSSRRDPARWACQEGHSLTASIETGVTDPVHTIAAGKAPHAGTASKPRYSWQVAARGTALHKRGKGCSGHHAGHEQQHLLTTDRTNHLLKKHAASRSKNTIVHLYSALVRPDQTRPDPDFGSPIHGQWQGMEGVQPPSISTV